MHDGVNSIAMRVRIIAELAMEIVSHANLCGAHAVALPKVFAAAPDCTNARAPKAVKNRAGGSLLRPPHKLSHTISKIPPLSY